MKRKWRYQVRIFFNNVNIINILVFCTYFDIRFRFGSVASPFVEEESGNKKLKRLLEILKDYFTLFFFFLDKIHLFKQVFFSAIQQVL
jgi:hypothetical protein